MALSREQGFAYWLGMGTILQAGRWPRKGREQRGCKQSPGLAVWRATGADAEAGRCFLALLAEACGRTGEAEEGLTHAGRGAGSRGHHSESLLRGGVVSAQGGVLLGQATQIDAARPKPAFVRPSTSPAASRPNRWSCGPP